jgi:hypothetical protein
MVTVNPAVFRLADAEVFDISANGFNELITQYGLIDTCRVISEFSEFIERISKTDEFIDSYRIRKVANNNETIFSQLRTCCSSSDKTVKIIFTNNEIYEFEFGINFGHKQCDHF